MMVNRLQASGGRSTFRALTDGASRVEVAVSFLAVLDLYKDEQVEVTQHANFGELVIELFDETVAVAAGDVTVVHRSMAVQGTP
jgi:chromatin segregation and condensation protein Rec8/ScpA/Scc1 (kleisin family)